MERKIDFLCIGAQKSGTSWLYKNLQDIEEFSLPQVKEIHYFDRSSTYPSPSKKSFSSRVLNPKYVARAIGSIVKAIFQRNFNKAAFVFKWNFALNYNDKWYLSLFKNLKGYKGEITPSYSILEKEDIKKIHKLLPDVKLILMLRNPIDRAWSHYRSGVSKTYKFDINNLDSSEIIKFMKSEEQTMRSNYLRTIDNYLEVFKKEQLLICFYDAIIDCSDILIKDILHHICGENSIAINHLNLRENVSVTRNKVNCPEEVKEFLKETYYHQIKELSEKYGGYFTKWYEEIYNEGILDKKRTFTSTLTPEKAEQNF